VKCGIAKMKRPRAASKVAIDMKSGLFFTRPTNGRKKMKQI